MNETAPTSVARAPSFRRVSILLLAALFVPAAGAQDGAEEPMSPQETAEAFLTEVRKKYDLPVQNGLDSFEARLSVRGEESSGLKWITDSLSIEYRFEAPATEELTVLGAPEQLRALIEDPFREFWKDIVGGAVFPAFAGRKLRLEPLEDKVFLFVARDEGEDGLVVFDLQSHLVLRAELDRRGVLVEIEPRYAAIEGVFRYEGKVERPLAAEAPTGGEVGFSYGAFRDLCGFHLPHSLALDVGGSRIAFSIDFSKINGLEPVRGEADIELVKELVKEYEKNYSKWGSDQKRAALRKLEATAHELAAEAIVKKGLKDSNLGVREDSAKTLGRMKCRKAVPALTRALKPNEKNLDVYLAVIQALGDIGDPQAVPYLAKDFWNQREGKSGIRTAQARIDALGNIRSKKSVEALIDMLFVAGPGAMLAVARSLQAALVKLTGEDFGWDRDQWKEWWKKNRNGFRLEED